MAANQQGPQRGGQAEQVLVHPLMFPLTGHGGRSVASATPAVTTASTTPSAPRDNTAARAELWSNCVNEACRDPNGVTGGIQMQPLTHDRQLKAQLQQQQQQQLLHLPALPRTQPVQVVVHEQHNSLVSTTCHSNTNRTAATGAKLLINQDHQLPSASNKTANPLSKTVLSYTHSGTTPSVLLMSSPPTPFNNTGAIHPDSLPPPPTRFPPLTTSPPTTPLLLTSIPRTTRPLPQPPITCTKQPAILQGPILNDWEQTTPSPTPPSPVSSPQIDGPKVVTVAGEEWNLISRSPQASNRTPPTSTPSPSLPPTLGGSHSDFDFIFPPPHQEPASEQATAPSNPQLRNTPHSPHGSPPPSPTMEPKKPKGVGNWRSKTVALVYNFYRAQPTAPPQFSTSTIWLLGHYFECVRSDGELYVNPKFFDDFARLIWITYRRDFPPIPLTSVTSDMGWGCMIRTGQMLLARAIVCKYICNKGCNFRQTDLIPFSFTNLDETEIIRLFADFPHLSCPFSIHNIVMRNSTIKRENGEEDSPSVEWFGPSKTAQILKYLVHQHPQTNMAVYVHDQGVIYRDQVEALCTAPALNLPQQAMSFLLVPDDPTAASALRIMQSQEGNLATRETVRFGEWRPCLLLLPLRLGVDHINEMYVEGLRQLMQLPQIVGIIGGKPSQSLYFVGCQDDNFIYLDPHIVQAAAPTASNIDIDTYHCQMPQMMRIMDIDPSLAIGIYCHNEAMFNNVCSFIVSISSHLPISVEATTPPDSEVFSSVLSSFSEHMMTQSQDFTVVLPDQH
ncbi:autophagy protein 4 [Pelomyxa schiedti]|nr:autophagy protein 4 [Pelomyxa schiedti]